MRHRGVAPRRSAIVVAAVAALAVCRGPALADSHGVVDAAAAARVEEAQLRFRRGVDLYTEGDFSGALVELKRAYELVPNFRILFNLGQVSYQSHDYAAAFEFLSRYVAEGDDRIPAARRQEVTRDLEQLRQRIGSLEIPVAVTGYRVMVDDRDLGTTPLGAPVTVNVGSHRVELIAVTGERQVRIVELPSGQRITVKFDTPLPQLKLPPDGSADPGLPPRAPTALDLSRSRPPHGRPDGARQEAQEPAARRSGPWFAWTLTGLMAGSAAVTGAFAWRTSMELQRKLDSYPVSQGTLDGLRDRERHFALASDGLLAGTLVLSAISLYLTFSRPTPAGDDTGARLAHAGW